MSDSTLLAAQNDQFRMTLGRPSASTPPGQVVLTSGVAALPRDRRALVLAAVAGFAKPFTRENDPHGEHDFGSVEVDDDRFFWKFDYFEDESCTYGAEQPATRCYRVLTVMFAAEY